MTEPKMPGEERVTDMLAALEASASAAKAARREKAWRDEAECGCGPRPGDNECPRVDECFAVYLKHQEANR